MKKLFTTLLASFMMVALVGCAQQAAPAPAEEEKEEEVAETLTMLVLQSTNSKTTS